jgi:hypothetical protein
LQSSKLEMLEKQEVVTQLHKIKWCIRKAKHQRRKLQYKLDSEPNNKEYQTKLEKIIQYVQRLKKQRDKLINELIKHNRIPYP